jgi:hypothetical protein
LQATNEKKTLKNDLESQLGKMRRLTNLLSVCEAKVYELSANFKIAEVEVDKLQALHISTLKGPKQNRPVMEIPKSRYWTSWSSI